MRRRWRGLRRLAAVLAFSVAAFARAEPEVSRENRYKAACLYNFAQFVEWPASAFADASAPIEIGIFGENPFGDVLQEIVRGQTIRGRRIEVKQSDKMDDLKSCQVLFMAKTEKARVNEFMAGAKDGPALTVSGMDGFIARGGMINFFLKDGKVRFEINNEAAKRYGLKISSQILSLGKRVETAREPEPK